MLMWARAARMERVGRAVALTELLSPMTGRPCVAYQAIVDEPGLFWRVRVVHEQFAEVFALDDGTRIEEVSRIHVRPLRCIRSGHFADPDERLQLFLFMHRQAHVDFVGLNRSLRYREGIVAPGDRVRVRGIGSWEPSADGPAGGYREPPMRLVLRKCAIILDE